MNISDSWSVIEQVLADKFPNILASLKPGAKEEDIRRLEEVIGRKIPSDLRESLMIHDGQADHRRLIRFVNYNSLLSIDEIIEDYKMSRDLFADWEPVEWLQPDKIRNVVWSPGWIKFTESEGDGYVVDLDPGPNGVAGQVFMRYHDDNSDVSTTRGASYEEFLSDCAEALHHGRYSVEQGLIVLDGAFE